MDRLTQKERAQLEEVFAAIYANRGSKFKNAYEYLFKKIATFIDRFKNRAVKNINFKKFIFR